MLHKEDFLKLSQDQKRKYLLEMREKLSLNTQSGYKDIKKLKYPRLRKNDNDRFNNFPLTDIQESFLIGKFYGMSQDTIGCHIYCEFEKRDLNVQKLKQNWMELVHHHEMLHTIIDSSGEQSILREIPAFDMPIHDLRMVDLGTIETHKQKVRNELSHKLYEAGQWPLFDLQFSLLPNDNVLIHLSIDEWIVDAASVDLLLDQWYQLYHDSTYKLPDIDVSFRDMVMAWKEFEQSDVFKCDLNYWMEKLETAPGGPSLPQGKPQLKKGFPYVTRYRLTGELEGEKWKQIKQKAGELEVSPTVLLLTLFSQVLEEYSDSSSFSLIQTYFNRLPLHPQLDQVVGPFVSTNIFVADHRFKDWKQQAQANQKQVWEDLDHSSVSGIRAMRELRAKQKGKVIPDFPVVFTSMLNNVGKVGQGRPSWFQYMTYNVTQTPQVYLDHQISERNGVLHFNWDVAEGYLPRPLVEEMFGRYERRLQEVILEEQMVVSSTTSSSFGLTDLQQTYVLGRLQGENKQSCQMYQEFQVEQLDVPRLQQVWQQLIEYHEMLRAIVHEDGTQEILTQVPAYKIPVNLAQDARQLDAFIQQVREELQNQVLPLGKWPLFDLRVTQGEELSYVHLCTDALIADGASLFLLYRQLMALYENPETKLSPLEVSYREYCQYINEQRQSVEGQKARAYWERKMATLVPGPIPSLTSNSSRSTIQGVTLDWRALKEKASRWGVKPGTVLLTAFQEVLSNYFGHAFTTVVVNWDRPTIHKQVNELIGDFTTLSYIESLSTERSFLHRARVNQRELEEDFSHHLVSGMHGLRKRAMSRKDEGFLSFPIVFTNLVEEEIYLPSGWEMGYSSSKTPGIYLDMIPVEKNGVLHFHWDVMEGLFSPGVKQTLFTRFSERLAELASDEKSWEGQPMESQTDTFSTIHEWFERQVDLYPQNLALKWNHEVMTYQTLNNRSNQLARYLQSRGVGPEVMVGICVERSLDMIVGILGILKAGGAYVPLDPAYPKDRLAYILEDSYVSLVLTQETVHSSLPETKATLICLDRDQHLWSSQAVTNLHVPVGKDGLAYVIYTSGSTGRPKGVLVTHQNVIRLMQETEEWYHFNERDTWTLYHSYAFDFSVWEIWGALLYGGKLIIVPYKTSRSFESFYELLVEERVTVLNQTPTAFRQLMRVDEQNEQPLALRYVIFGGEALDPRMLQGWFERHGDQKPQLVNMYGITETTVHVTYRRITKKDTDSPSSVIGTPIRDLQVYILDEHLQAVPSGTVGEMYVGGGGVARGYLNQEKLTKERFIPSPFTPQERLYKTGDLAHYTESGELAFVGRNDNQVKVRGFRIELGEIEAALKTNELIEDAVVTVKDDLDDQQIIAYIVGDYSASTSSIRQYLRDLLPIYMLPNLIIPITRIPLTVNGKLDYKKLPEVIVEEKMDNQLPVLEDKSIINNFIEVMKRDVKLSDNLFDLGVTSITIVKIAQAIQANCGIAVPVEVFLESKNINEIIRYVQNNQPAGLTEPSSNISYTQYLIEIIEEITGTRIADENEDIFNLGVTSLTIMKLSQRFKEEKGIHLPVEVFLENPTITGISTYINQNTSIESESYELGIGNQEQASIIELENIEFQDRHYISRRNLINSGENHSFSIDKLSELMSLLRIKNLEGKDRYLYPSAGGKYTVQTYVLIKGHVAEELEPGIYYYHPEMHGLVLIQRIEGIEKDIFAKNDQISFENSNVCLFFIAQLEALIPFYGEEFSKGLAILDGGYINQLLISRMPSLDLNAKVINAMNFTRIKDLFQLDDNHMYIHSICINNAPVKNKSEDKQSIPDMQDSLRNYLLSKQHEVVPVADMSKTIKYTMNDPQTLEELMKKRVHIRRVKTGEDIFLLKENPINESDYYVRASQRTYDKSLITFHNFSKFLSLLQPNTSFNHQYLYYNMLPIGSVKFYLYIKKEVIKGIDAGLYQYDPVNHKLLLIKQDLSFDMEYTHSPFNRELYRNSGFCLIATTDVNEVAFLYGDYAKQLAFFEVGNIGQLLMDRQAEFDIGLVPIGGHNFEKLRVDFSLAENEILLHSFLGGSLKHSHSRNKEDLLLLKDLSQVDSTKKQEEFINIKEVSSEQPPVSDDIAIIGLSGRYPDATNMDEYWRNLRIGKHSITHLPKERFKLYNLEVMNDGDKNDQWAGYIQEIDHFDSLLFNITPSEARNMDPQERLALQTVWECLEDAGYTADSLKSKAPEIGVFVGAMWNDYQNYGESEWEKNQQAEIAAIHSSIANRISHYFGLIGPSISINTSCSSSLTAIHLAYESVKRGECDAAIMVGVNLISHPYHYDSLHQQGLLSTNDRSAAFSAEGTGLVPGEGIGALLIKQVKEAVDHKDHIYGVIKGSVINHYGEASRYGSPNKKMQVSSIQKLLNKTATPLEAIDYIECAATGSSMADASELNAIKEVFKNQHLKVGSVKPNIGHLESASAMSQLSKVLLQFKYGEIAPTIHTKPVNPFLMLEDGQIEIIDKLTAWKTSKLKHTLISSYGAMGSIGHLLIKEYRKNHTETLLASRSEVCLFSAASKEQLKRYAERFISFLDHSEKDVTLQDIAFTLHVGRREMNERMAIIAEDIADLKNKLEAYISHSNNLKNVYIGTVDGSTERDLWDKENYAVMDIASSWIKGSKVNIEKFFEDGNRVPLPTYPFEQVSHWYPNKTIIPPDIAEKSIFDQGEIKEAPHLFHEEEGDEKLENFLLEAFSEITEIPLDRLDKRTSFESYGINSLLITRLNEKLEVAMGITSKTLFFENQNIEELARCINRTHYHKVVENEKQPDRNKDSKEQKGCSSVNDSLSDRDHMSNYSDSDLAIIGLSGKYAQADNLLEFWENLKLGKDCITEIPKERWNNDYYFNEDKRSKGTVYGKWGGFIRDVKKFDSLFFNISPKEAERTDPQERLFLQTTWECIEDAGYTRSSLQRKHQGNVGVFVGAMYQEYPLYGHLDKYNSSENVALGSSAGSIANRISYFFNFQGPSLAIDTMCSSALTSLHYAAQSIKGNECEVAVVGGVNLLLHPNKYLMHSQMKMLSSDGRCRSFGKDGDGFVPGEGIGSVLIKPLKKAIQDGDNIYAVIKGTAINNDGKTNGYTVPNPKQQEDVIKRALEKAQINPRTITYIEAHGTGTELGDPIEITGLTNAYRTYTQDNQYCAIGSVKSNIGHCESAAGIAGLTKVVLQLKNKQLLPSIHADELNPNINFEETPFVLQRKFEDWKKPKAVIDGVEQQFPRRAGISSFGAGGVNAHIILEEYIPIEQKQTKVEEGQQEQLILLSASNDKELTQYALNLLSVLGKPLESVSKVKEKEILQCVAGCLSPLIDVEVNSLDINEDVGQILDPLSYKELEEQLQKLYGENIEIPSILDEMSITSIAKSIIESLQLSPSEIESTTSSQRVSLRLKDISHTLKVGREPMRHRLALIVANTDELIQQLSTYIQDPSKVNRSSSIMVGIKPDRVDSIWEDRELKGVIANWIKKNKLRKLADLWIKGVDIQWPDLLEGYCRVTLPTYPFEGQIHWPSISEDVREERESKPVVKYKAFEESLSKNKKSLGLTNESTQTEIKDTCIEIISKVIKLPKENLDLLKSFSDYGVDSIAITEISEEIKERLALDISAIDFFEATTINEFLNSLPFEKASPQNVNHGETALDKEEIEEEDRENQAYHVKQIEDNQRVDTPVNEPIAIIGMNGKLPGADTINGFWESICQGESHISLIPKERWDWEQYYGDPLKDGNYTDVKYGGFIKDIDKFDNNFFGISPKEATLMDPQQRLFLETTWKAIEDAGYKPSDINGSKTGVFVGVSNKDYDHFLEKHDVSIEAHIATGNSHAILANRVSYFYNLRGPSEAVDTACSSSIVAIHRAIKAIQSNECDMALAGGVNILLSPKDFIAYRKAGMLTPTNMVKTFNEDADGYIRGEGVGAILLKPLSKAKEDGDHIYAVIRGSAVNHNGKGFALTVPSANAQADVIKDAWQKSGISPSTISYIETQGTGTKMGDAIEIRAIIKAFEDISHSPRKKCGIGSVKPNIGHLEAASGMASLFKVIKSLENKMIPMTANVTELNKEIDLVDTPFYIVNQSIPWDQNDSNTDEQLPRRASIHSFGVGGTNAHLVIEEYVHDQVKVENSKSKEPFLFLCSAKTEDQLLSYLHQIREHMIKYREINFEDIIYTLHVGREDMEERIAMIVKGKEDFLHKCNEFLRSPNTATDYIYRSSLGKSVKSLDSSQTIAISPATKSHNDLVDLADAWINFDRINWNEFYKVREVKRVPLPTYPFKKVRRWIELPVITNKPKDEVKAQEVQVVRKEEQVENKQNDTPDISSKIAVTVADLLGYEKQEIPLELSLIEIGMDSVTVMKLQYILKRDLDLSIPLTMLNNNLSINEICNNILDLKSGQKPLDIESLTSEQLDDLFLRIKS